MTNLVAISVFVLFVQTRIIQSDAPPMTNLLA
jgi:hypothetical protein